MPTSSGYGAFEALADRIVRGAQEAFVEDLTARMADLLARCCRNPDRYAVLARLAPEEASRVLAEHAGEVSSDVEAAFMEALSAADEADVAALSAHAAADAGDALSAYARNRVREAARGMSEVVRRQNVALASTLEDAWYSIAGGAVTRMGMGGGFRDAMEEACSRLADAGIETVDYRSGARTSADAAVRRHVVTQANQCRQDLLFARMDEWGHDLVYTSAHYGARPSHASWQGRVFSRSGSDGRYQSLAAGTGYGTVTGLCGANCRHVVYPYVEGVSKLPDTDFSAQEARFGMTGDEYYAAVQRQRALERAVRQSKRRIAVGQAQGLDMAAERYRLGRAQARLREHVSANRLTRDPERERAYGVAVQPRALSLSVAENRAREDARSYRVDARKVASKGYAAAVREVFGTCGDVALADARRMLAHRGGTAGEDLYAYDLTDGRRIGSVVSSRARMSVGPSDRMRGLVEAAVAAGHEVATMHNHPGSSIPSAGDIATLKATGCAFGVVACHDGSLYVYRIVGEPAPGYTLRSASGFIDRRLGGDEGEAMEAIETMLGVRIEHIRPR